MTTRAPRIKPENDIAAISKLPPDEQDEAIAALMEKLVDASEDELAEIGQLLEGIKELAAQRLRPN